MNGALLSSREMGWQTPDSILSLVRAVSPIGLDPATTRENPAGAATWFYPPAFDGLIQAWAGHGLAYVNPPYGRALPRWIEKCKTESLSPGARIIALVPSRTDTRWWHEGALSARSVCFVRGRIKFVGAPSAAPFPSAFLYWGDGHERFREVFSTIGYCT